MAGETNTDRIRELERENATLVERVDNLKRDIERIENKIDEISTRRWEMMKIVFAALVGAVLATIGFFAKAILDHRTGPDRSPPTATLPERQR